MGIAQSVQSQRLEYLCDNLLSAVAAVVGGVLIVTWALYGVVSDSLLFGWAFFALLMSMIRLWSHFHIKHLLLDPQNYPAIERLMIVTATMSGLIWGVGSILFCLSTDMFYWVFLAFVLSGYASGSVFTTSVSMPACAGYFFPTLLPITVWFFFQDDPRAPMMGLLLIIFIAAAWNVARNSSRMLLHGYALIAERAELSDSLEERNKQLNREVSEHKKTSTELRKSEHSYRQLIEHAPVGILVVRQGEALFSNHYWHELMQHSTAPSYPVTPLEELACISDRQRLAELLMDDKVDQLAVPIAWHRPSCTALHTEVSALPIRFNEEGATLLLINEIESRIKAEEAAHLKHQNEAFAQRLEALQTMAGGIAHDFNNLLSAILGNASLAMNHLGEENRNLNRFLLQIELAGDRAAILCRQMLAYSGHGAFVVEPVNIGHFFHDHLSAFVRMIEKNIEIKSEFADSLVHVDVDPRQLQQLLENLLCNAAEAYQGQTGVISITTAVHQVQANEVVRKNSTGTLSSGQYVSLQIQDKGCGMSDDTLRNIFDPFFTTKFAGRGLGMSAVFGIVRELKGDLHIDSGEGEGTKVSILLPASTATPVNAEPRAVEIIQDESAKGQKVALLVDDEAMIREVGSSMLESFGFKVLVACDGLEALKIYGQRRHEIDVVILDMTMPRMGGKACFIELHAINPKVHVIISSGYSMEDIAIQLGDCKPSGMLQKPYTPAMMQEAVHAIMQS
ncbi:MAG: response regulator [Mariprofundus sp.]|nr:response regulator [Mariprofundus sp.]